MLFPLHLAQFAALNGNGTELEQFVQVLSRYAPFGLGFAVPHYGEQCHAGSALNSNVVVDNYLSLAPE
jgi:hypothetical protein